MRVAKARGKQIGKLRRYFDERKAAELRAQGAGSSREEAWNGSRECESVDQKRCPRVRSDARATPSIGLSGHALSASVLAPD
jgi:hypothetical protein